MNTNESDFENQLRTLRPIAPSLALEESIARTLASHRAVVIHRSETAMERPGLFERIFPGLRWAFAGAAAALAVISAIHHFDPPATLPAAPAVAVAEPDFEPVEVTRALVTTEDGGVVYENEDEPARLVRYTTLERHVWTHPVTGARLEVEVPREDLVLVPIAMQ